MRDWADQGYPAVDETRAGDFANDTKELLAEYELMRQSDADLRHVLFAALHNEPDGIDLVHRLTTYAVNQRREPK